MTREERKHYLRLIYSGAFRLLGIGLVISALVGGLYGQRMYAVWAMCAVGSILICWGWFRYLRMDGMRIFGFKPNPKGEKVPYVHQRFKKTRPNRPAFRKDSADFDDDLNDATAVDAGRFSEREGEMAQVWARIAAGVLLFLVSLFI